MYTVVNSCSTIFLCMDKVTISGLLDSLTLIKVIVLFGSFIFRYIEISLSIIGIMFRILTFFSIFSIISTFPLTSGLFLYYMESLKFTFFNFYSFLFNFYWGVLNASIFLAIFTGVIFLSLFLVFSEFLYNMSKGFIFSSFSILFFCLPSSNSSFSLSFYFFLTVAWVDFVDALFWYVNFETDLSLKPIISSFWWFFALISSSSPPVDFVWKLLVFLLTPYLLVFTRFLFLT